MAIPFPSKKEIQKVLKKFYSLKKYAHYIEDENSLKSLLTYFPFNNKLKDVNLKVRVINDCYSTNIFSKLQMAKHITNLNIDKGLKEEDLELVNKIRNGHNIRTKKNNKESNFYSFATKYCSFHKPDIYPIYDSNVAKMLWTFKERNGFADFKKKDLKNYIQFKKILLKFQSFYNLEDFTLKQIDWYLWLVGKEYFPKKY